MSLAFIQLTTRNGNTVWICTSHIVAVSHHAGDTYVLTTALKDPEIRVRESVDEVLTSVRRANGPVEA